MKSDVSDEVRPRAREACARSTCIRAPCSRASSPRARDRSPTAPAGAGARRACRPSRTRRSAARTFPSDATSCSECARCRASRPRTRAAVARSAIRPVASSRPAVRVDVLAEQRHFLDALVGEIGDLGQHVVERPRHFLAARVRHDAERAVLAAAFHDRHERASRRRRAAAADGRTSRSRGTRCRPAARRIARRARIIAGSRCSVCGPNTRSTYGARATIAAPSCDATQPPTPISTSGRAALSARTRPRSWNTRSCAFSRTEQVLNRMTSASSGRSVEREPSEAASTSAMRSESYSFIWQPNVRM